MIFLFLVNLNNLKDINSINTVFKVLNTSLFKDKIYVKLDLRLSEISDILNIYSDIPIDKFVDFLLIDCTDLTNFDINCFIELLYKFEKPVCILNGGQFKTKFLKDLSEIGLDKLLMFCEDYFDSSSISEFDLDLIKDFYAVGVNKKKFCNEDFLTGIEIYDDLTFKFSNSKELLVLMGNEFDNLLFNKLKSIPKTEPSNCFGPYLYSPWVFILGVSDEEIVQYKINLFNNLKDLNPKKILSLPKCVREFILSRPYVNLNDAKSILLGEDDFSWI